MFLLKQEKLKIQNTISIILFYCLATAHHTFAIPIIQTAIANKDTVALYSKFELTITLTASFSNPFNPNELNLRAVFTSPTGKSYTLYGFYYQDFIRTGPPETLAVNGPPIWKIRFVPNEIGTWTYTILCTDNSGTGSYPTKFFHSISSNNPGFVRRANNRYLKFDNGEQFFAIGENLAWYEYPDRTFSYNYWLDKLALEGANYIRLWMSENAFAIEWKNTGLGNYSNRFDRAYQLDWVLDYAAQKNIYIQMCLVPHGQFSTHVNSEWNDNPYNTSNGGPCSKPWEFFTNSSAKNFFMQKLRYIIARWGYSPNLMAWELFNEVDHTDSFDVNRTSISNWLLEMAQFLKTNDHTNRLVTTSYANEFLDSNVWSSSLMDFTQIHHYNTTTDMQTAQNDLTELYLNDFSKPSSIGEYDFLEFGSWAFINDPNGINLHNSLWASAMSGAFGTASPWSWDIYIDPKNLYHHFKPISEFMKSIDLLGQNFTPIKINLTASLKVDFPIAPAYPKWGKGPVSNFNVTSDGQINPTAINLSKFLYGSVYNTEHRNPPLFFVDYSNSSEFKVIVGNAIGASPRIQIWLDGIKKVDQIANVNATYSITVPAGSRQIFVDNQGLDWMRIAEYVFSNFVVALRGYAMKGNSEIVGWIHNRNYNWRYLRDLPSLPPIVNDGVIVIPSLSNSGLYSVEWWNCSTGIIERIDTVTSIDDTLRIDVPPVQWDYAFKAKYLGPTSVASDEQKLFEFKLYQNYPNPFNPSTIISFELPVQSYITLKVYDLLGREVATLVNEERPVGIHNYELNADKFSLASGVYLIQLKAGKFSDIKKIVLMK